MQDERLDGIETQVETVLKTERDVEEDLFDGVRGRGDEVVIEPFAEGDRGVEDVLARVRARGR